MGYCPIVNRNQKQMEGLLHRELPRAYMEDFSIMGFRVEDCERAIAFLKAASFDLKHSPGGTQVKIEEAARVEAVIQVLRANGQACEWTDVAQGMYQG